MRTISLIAGLFLILLPIDWIKLLVVGRLPTDAVSVSIVLVGSAFIFALSAALIVYGFKTDAKTIAPGLTPAAPVPSNVGGGGTGAHPLGTFSRIIDALMRPYRNAVARREAERARLQQELDDARSATLVPVYPGNLVLHGDEKAFASIAASLLELRTVGYAGRSTGVSVRVAKGVWLRQSGSRGTAQKGMVPVSAGLLFATNKQIVFTGDRKSAAVPLKKVAFFEPLVDGVRFSNGSKTFTFLTGRSHNHELFVIVAQRLLNEQGGS